MNSITISSLLLLRSFAGLLMSPYKTMRRISIEKDRLQPVLIFSIVYGYFFMASSIRQKTLHPFIISSSSTTSFLFFLTSFFLSILFFASMGYLVNKKTSFKPLFFSFAYSLVPTLIWFFVTSLLYYFLPPPRTLSFLGQGFSFVYITFSLTLLLWRIILLYLSVRFSLKTDFYLTLFFIVLYLLWFVPYSYGLYYLTIFRIPFI